MDDAAVTFETNASVITSLANLLVIHELNDEIVADSKKWNKSWFPYLSFLL